MMKRLSGSAFFYILLLIFISFACANNLREKINGIWIIETINHNSSDIFNDLRVNMITFDKDGKCTLPIPNSSNIVSEEWRVEKDTLIISGDIVPFSGKYTIQLDDVDGKTSVRLKSAKTDIKAIKMLSQF